MRGKQKGESKKEHYHGITPAHAGKTALMPDGGAVKWDHPRACGENMGYSFLCWENAGSPPRMRGKHLLKLRNNFTIRITPAHAGKTSYPSSSRGCLKDHPRACGENKRAKVKRNTITGSPPRMRGKLEYKKQSAIQSRITPAHAGKTVL